MHVYVERNALQSAVGCPQPADCFLRKVPFSDRPRIDALLDAPVLDEASDAGETHWLKDSVGARRWGRFGADHRFVWAADIAEARRLHRRLSEAPRGTIEPIQEAPSRWPRSLQGLGA